MRCLPLLLAVGCIPEGGTLNGGFEGLFTQASGCRDITAFATTPLDDVALVFQHDSLLQAAIDSGGAPSHVEMDADEVDRLDALTGEVLTAALCGDAAAPVIEETYRAVSGTVVLDIRPNMSVDDLPRLDLQFVNVGVRDEATREILVISNYRIENVPIGWEP